MGIKENRKKIDKYATWGDQVRALAHGANREQYLQERAAANEAAEKARLEEEEKRRREGAKSRRGMY